MQMTSFTVRGAYERTETTGWLLKDVFFLFTNHPGPPGPRAVRGRLTYNFLLFMVYVWTKANDNTAGGGGFHHDVGTATPRIINAKRSQRGREGETLGRIDCGVRDGGVMRSERCCLRFFVLRETEQAVRV